MKSYKSIRIACDILDRADRCGAEAFFLVGMGDRRLNGEFTDQMTTEYPDIVRVMDDLEATYTRDELDQAFQLLLECEA
ncbi:hypothetical protein [uncultured Desulfovibrio sp.]|uniref:hypothetical protein n=1 Tax=uncultured Desulfovibrio sp. TaxID=167968 RepID=UPI00266EC010|nr:hypothetical protein [uncultured Desulfovibrio sp.]